MKKTKFNTIDLLQELNDSGKLELVTDSIKEHGDLSMALTLGVMAIKKHNQLIPLIKSLLDDFPEFETDEPINGSEAVDIICRHYKLLKDAIK